MKLCNTYIYLCMTHNYLNFPLNYWRSTYIFLQYCLSLFPVKKNKKNIVMKHKAPIFAINIFYWEFCYDFIRVIDWMSSQI